MSRPDRRPDRGVRSRVARRHVVEREGEVDDVLVARRVVPAQAAGLDRHTQRVRAAGDEARVAVPGHEPDVTLRRRDDAPEHRVVEVVGLVDLDRHSRGVGPRGGVGRVLEVVDRLHAVAMLRRALGVEEEGARHVAVPRPTGVARPCRRPAGPELKTNWLPVPLGQKPPPMVDEFVESTPMLPLDELRPRYTRLTVMAPRRTGEQAEAPRARARLGLRRGRRGNECCQRQRQQSSRREASRTQQDFHCCPLRVEAQPGPTEPWCWFGRAGDAPR